MTLDLDKIKALALAAPKDWYGIYQIADGVTDNDAAALMKACSPAAVLELTAEVERLRADAARYRWLRDKANSQSGRAPMVLNCDPDDALSWSTSLWGQSLDDVMDYVMDAAIEKEKA